MFANPNKQYLVGVLRVVVDRLTFGLAIATSRSSGQIAVARLPKAFRPRTAVKPAHRAGGFGKCLISPSFHLIAATGSGLSTAAR